MGDKLTKAQERVMKTIYEKGFINETINTWSGFQFKTISPLLTAGLIKKFHNGTTGGYRSSWPQWAICFTEAGRAYAISKGWPKEDNDGDDKQSI